MVIENPESLLPVSRIVIGRDRQQAEEIPFAVRHGTARSGDAQAVQGVDAGRRFEAGDFFPAQSLVPIDLVPVQAAEFRQGFQRRVALGFLQSEKIALENGMVQIQPNRRFRRGAFRRIHRASVAAMRRYSRRWPDETRPMPTPRANRRQLRHHAANARYRE